MLISANNCYSTGNIGYNTGYCGGIFGSNTLNCIANNCYSNGIIGAGNDGLYGCGGIFGYNTLNCIANNCYSIGSILGDGGGIFGIFANNNSSANNCYTIGSYRTIYTSAGGIFGYPQQGIQSKCIYVNGSSSNIIPNPTQVANIWQDSNAQLTINQVNTSITPSIIPNWYNYNPSSTPWLISTFNAMIYSPNSKNTNSSVSTTSTPGLFVSNSSITYTYSITSITYNSNITNTSGITINTNNGILIFPTGILPGTYIVNILVGVLSSAIYYAYNNNNFTLSVNSLLCTITANPSSIVNTGTVINFNASSSGGSGSYSTYTWFKGSTQVQSSSLDSYQLRTSLSDNGSIITCRVTDSLGSVSTSNGITLSINKISPTIKNFSIPSRSYKSIPFTIIAPESNSAGSFIYSSSDTSIATIDGNVITILNLGTTIITAFQEEYGNYISGTIKTTLKVYDVINNINNKIGIYFNKKLGSFGYHGTRIANIIINSLASSGVNNYDAYKIYLKYVVKYNLLTLPQKQFNRIFKSRQIN